MKQSILLLLCIATLGLASCKKEYITPNARTFVYNVQPNEWVLDASGYTYTARLDIPEIDQITLDDEGVLVYINHPANTAGDSDIQLPYTFDVQAYSAEIYNGGIAIDVQSSSISNPTPVKPINPIRVKIVVIPSTFVP